MAQRCISKIHQTLLQATSKLKISSVVHTVTDKSWIFPLDLPPYCYDMFLYFTACHRKVVPKATLFAVSAFKLSHVTARWCPKWGFYCACNPNGMSLQGGPLQPTCILQKLLVHSASYSFPVASLRTPPTSSPLFPFLWEPVPLSVWAANWTLAGFAGSQLIFYICFRTCSS